jgi:inner membrane protein
MDTSWLDKIVFWHWWILAIVLMCIELFAPAAFFIWCGIAAAIVGLIVLILPAMSWEIPFLLFAILSVVSVLVGRKYLQQRGAMESDQPMLNRRGEQYVGRVFTLNEPVVDGTGRVQVDDSSWRIEGQDMAAGVRVKVVAINGSTLKVVKVD